LHVFKTFMVCLLLCCQVLTAKRAEVIAAIREVQGAVAEDAWLEDYEADEGRYKVSSVAGRVMQRSKLPAGVARHVCCLNQPLFVTLPA
jgi:hypothetical protein